jgi:hypothetical protein
MKQVPVFPLPNVVFFPKTTLPLHIFEPRYRQMVAHALDRDRLIAVALLKPGWEKDYQGAPDYYPVATLGRITEHEKLEDGRYNILLEGIERVHLLEDQPAAQAGLEPAAAPPDSVGTDPITYRRAWAVPSPERLPQSSTKEEEAYRIQLVSLVNELRESMDSKGDDLPFPEPGVSFEVFVNHIAGSLDVAEEVKQSLLELDDLMVRVRSLDAALRERVAFWKMLRQFRRLAPKDAQMN